MLCACFTKVKKPKASNKAPTVEMKELQPDHHLPNKKWYTAAIHTRTEAFMRKIIQCIFALMCSFLFTQANASSLQAMEQVVSDAIITTKITTKFTENVRLNPLKISVSTQQGQVTLSGHVKNKEAFVEALRLSISTQGVKMVNADHLDIKRVNTALTDAYITAKVEAAILEAKVFDDESIPLVGINATTVNGRVTLTGEVKHRPSISAILKRANAVRGVKKIISNLQVKRAGE